MISVLQKWPNLDYLSVIFGFFETFLAKPHLVARQKVTFSTFGWCLSDYKGEILFYQFILSLHSIPRADIFFCI